MLMPYTIARHAGYCAGVRKAMEIAVQAAREARGRGIPCYSLGELIHNPEAVQALREEGVIPVGRVEEAESGMILLRSHGVSPQVEEQCRKQGLIIRDCTCASVRALHSIVRESGEKGIPVILVGEPDHPEVQGTAGWCNGTCFIIHSEEEAEALPPLDTALAVSQTTFSLSEWEKILSRLKARIPNLDVRRTICPATQIRQTEACQLAAQVDAMVVVGGKKSANTRKLYEACKAICPRTILVERADEIPPHFADIHKNHIGIAAGASTPDWSFKEVVTRMNEQERIDQETQEPVANVEQEVQENQEAQALTMEDIEKTVVRIRPGQTVTGTVVQITDDEVCVNIGYKSDGLIKRSEMVEKDVNLGDEIEVEVVKVNDGEGNVLLSQRNIVNRKAWDALMEKFENNEYIDAVGKEAVKGGLLASVEGGVRAFVPASQLAQRYVEKIGQFVGQPMKLKIIDVDKQKKRIVASRKQVIEEENAAKKAAAWEKLEEGAVVTGIVRRFADFGAFVDLGGVDGLIHITDLAWSRVGHPSEVLQVNQEVEVKILSLDRERERIQLGYKQLQPKPWDNIEEKYPVGTILERNVVRIRPFGAFIELEPGVDGLVHISQCALTRIAKVEDVLEVGQPVRVKVLAVDPEAKRISLSIREALADEAFVENDNLEIPGEVEEAPVAEEAPAEEAPADAE